MTIDNLFMKCQEKKIDQFFAVKDYKDHETLKNYDDTTKSGKKSIEQVKIIIQVLKNFKELSSVLESHPDEKLREALAEYRSSKRK